MARNLSDLPLPQQLAHLVTDYDRRQMEKARQGGNRGYHNPYALGLYLGRVDDVVAAVAKGATLEAALRRNFNDRLLAYLLRETGHDSSLRTTAPL